MLRPASQMKNKTFSKCHDGVGDLLCRVVTVPEDGFSVMRFMHDDTLPPGVSIGEHRHDTAEEIYFVAEGTGTLIMDGQRSQVGPGDFSVCRIGHSHGLINDGQQPLRLIVIGMKERV